MLYVPNLPVQIN